LLLAQIYCPELLVIAGYFHSSSPPSSGCV